MKKVFPKGCSGTFATVDSLDTQDVAWRDSGTPVQVELNEHGLLLTGEHQIAFIAHKALLSFNLYDNDTRSQS